MSAAWLLIAPRTFSLVAVVVSTANADYAFRHYARAHILGIGALPAQTPPAGRRKGRARFQRARARKEERETGREPERENKRSVCRRYPTVREGICVCVKILLTNVHGV